MFAIVSILFHYFFFFCLFFLIFLNSNSLVWRKDVLHCHYVFVSALLMNLLPLFLLIDFVNNIFILFFCCCFQ